MWLELTSSRQPFPIEAHSILELVATKRRDGANSPRDDDGQTSNGGLRQGSPVESGSGPSSRAPKRPYDAADDGEGPEADVEGEPDFQQDRRHLVHRTKVTALESWPTRVKFRRMAIGQSRLAMASENPSSALPNSSQQVGAGTSGPPAPDPGGGSASNERRSSESAYTRRTAWTAHDTDVLIKLIGEVGPRYAKIQRDHNHRFEYPRGQQAYRDKARNLKVDFLLADMRLPPEFDRVSLAAKEVEKLERACKNPARKEHEVDAEGRPTNTVWLE